MATNARTAQALQREAYRLAQISERLRRDGFGSIAASVLSASSEIEKAGRHLEVALATRKEKLRSVSGEDI